jgi:hypothetical protein
MGKIFPMPSEKARQGFLRKREKEAKRAAARQASSVIANLESDRAVTAAPKALEGARGS